MTQSNSNIFKDQEELDFVGMTNEYSSFFVKDQSELDTQSTETGSKNRWILVEPKKKRRPSLVGELVKADQFANAKIFSSSVFFSEEQASCIQGQKKEDRHDVPTLNSCAV